MLTEKEYVKTSGSVCPKCGSDKIKATGRTDLVCSYVYSSVMCEDCSFEYEDHYELVGYAAAEVERENEDE